MHPGAADSETIVYNVARVFKAPYTGTVTIGTNGSIIEKNSPASSAFDVNIRILHNSDTVWPSGGGWEYLSGSGATSAFAGAEIEVARGDEIVFEVNRGSAKYSDLIQWTPVITYTSFGYDSVEKVVFSDDFNSGAMRGEWYSKLGEWSVQNGALSQASTENSFSNILLDMPHATDYTVSFKLKFDSLSATSERGFLLGFRHVSGAGSGYNILLETRTGDVIFRRDDLNPSGGVARVGGIKRSYRSSGGTSPSVAYATDTAYDVTMAITGGVATVTIGDYTFTQNMVNASNPLIPAGGICLSSFGCAVSVDDVQIKGYSAQMSVGAPSLYADDGAVAAEVSITAPFEEFTYSNDVMMALAVYDGSGRLIGAKTASDAISIGSEGKLQVCLLSEEIDSDCVARVFLWDGLSTLCPYIGKTERGVSAITDPIEGFWRFVPADDSALAYTGRWDYDGASGVNTGTWIAPYVTTAFTGTSLYADFGRVSAVYVSIDGNDETLYTGAIGKTDISGGSLADTAHTVRLRGASETTPVSFKGFYMDYDSVVSAPLGKALSIQFIGDSITAAGASGVGYSYLTPNAMDADFTIIARSAVSLRDGLSSTDLLINPLNRGMESAYFDTQTVAPYNTWNTITPWGFANENPDIILVNLGANDALGTGDGAEDQADFEASYLAFITALRNQHQSAKIYVFKPLRKLGMNDDPASHHALLSDAFLNMRPALTAMENVFFIDTTDWDITYNADDIHPDAAGHADLAERIEAILTA